MKFYCHLLAMVLMMHSCSNKNGKESSNQIAATIESSDIRIRDPFILADEKTKTYYLYASIQNRSQNEREGQGVEVYTSKDLQHWTAPKTVFQVPEDFWATKWVWAPEVHFYKGKYYLFTTFTSHDLLENAPTPPTDNWPSLDKRGSQVLVADSPLGPFSAFHNKPHTPIDWMTIDGTFWEEDDQPYMLYCHEWTQIKDGTMDLIALSDDLSQVKGENQVLFKASDASWTRPVADGNAYITDGCYLYQTETSRLFMIWLSKGSHTDEYAIGFSESSSGSIMGPWVHSADPLFEDNGGHPMIFETFEGQILVSLHQPNNSPKERMQFYKLKVAEDGLELDGKMF